MTGHTTLPVTSVTPVTPVIRVIRVIRETAENASRSTFPSASSQPPVGLSVGLSIGLQDSPRNGAFLFFPDPVAPATGSGDLTEV